MADNVRMTAWFAGRVQGVGFRASTQQIAETHLVAGYVQNLSDGRVRLTVEGDACDVDALIAQVCQRLGRHIQDVKQERGRATGEFGAPELGALRIRY